MVRQSKYTLLIICEGKNTEPLFFNSIRDRILEGKYLINENIAVPSNIICCSYNEAFSIRGELLICFRKDLSLEITNTSKHTLIIPAGSITKTLLENGARQQIGDRIVIRPGESVKITFAGSGTETQSAEYSFNYADHHLMLGV